MNEMIAFLNTRLDEKERRALGTPLDRAEADARTVLPWLNELAPPVPRDETALREVAAMRAIVKRHVPVIAGYGPLEGQECCAAESSDEDMWYAKPWPCATVCVIVAIWSDHADYRDEWKP